MRPTRRHWHFWDNRPCVNLFSSMLFKNRRILRNDRPTVPPPLWVHRTMLLKEPLRLGPSTQNAKELASFWNIYYKTSEWFVHFSEKTVFSMLQKENATILCIRNQEGEIVGTVASMPLTGTFISQSEELKQSFFQVECLVLHPNVRGKGVAGWLLAWLDYLTSLNGPVVHSWLRESRVTNTTKLSKMTVVPYTKMIVAQMNLSHLKTKPHPEKVDALPWKTVQALFHEIRNSKDYGFDLLYIPNESPHITWWKVGIPEHPSCAMIVGISDTHRLRGKHKIYNVVFTCFARVRPGDDVADPFWYEDDSYCPYIQDCIEAAAVAQKCDILNVSNQPTCGDPFLKKWTNCIMSERKRKLYLYNWNYPSFINGSIVWPL